VTRVAPLPVPARTIVTAEPSTGAFEAPSTGSDIGSRAGEWPRAHLAAGSIDPAGCVSETGTNGACVDGTALDGATGVALSPDGMNVYVASETSRSVSVFSRDPGTGAIAQLQGTDGCVSDSGTGGACVDGTALVGPRSVALSPDGKNLYFPATSAAAVAIFARDQTTGALRQLAGTSGCISESGTNGACAVGRALSGARSAAVSPDGTSIYVASYFSDAVAVFSRNATTGTLIQLGGEAGCVSETGTNGACTDGIALDGARAVVVSPDGTNVYVASEVSGAVAIFTRNTISGALTQLAGSTGCVSQTGTGGACIDDRALGGAGGIAVSAEGDHVYVASMGSDAVAIFSRDPGTGALEQVAGTAGCLSETGTSGTCLDGTALDRARSVSISPDGSSVYVAGEMSDAIAVFSRDATTGTLTQLGGTDGCVSDTGTGGACADGTALDAARAVSVSPDGKTVYAASFGSSAVSLFARDPTTGALAQLGSPTPPPVGQRAFLSLRATATVGGLTIANEDVVSFDGSRFSLSFDGSDVGVAALRIDAFAWLDEDSLLLSFDAPGLVPGIAGTVDDSDIVRFDATTLGSTTSGMLGFYFDGSDVGLTQDAHDVDAVEASLDGRILLSTTGSVALSGMTARDEDVIAFTPASLGQTTTGTSSLSFDGSDVGLGDGGEDVDAVAIDASGLIYLSGADPVAVPGVAPQDEDVFVFSPTALDPPTTAGSYATALYFDGSTFALGANDISGLDLLDA
jgi:6-phosphogluconolactonase (cycloisomerase 2 family)